MIITDFPAWRNGEFCQIKDLTISVLDLGLIHCDGTYDVISVKDKRIFLLDDHLDRFEQSSNYWRFDLPVDRQEIKDIINELCRKSNYDNLLIWIGVTRGIPSSGNPRDLASAKNNMFIYVKPYFGFNRENSASVCIAKTIRVPDFSINQKYKNFAWNDLTIAQWEANDRGFDTAVLLDYQGNITEGPGFNVWFIQGDTVVAPARNCLGGITVVALERLCNELDINFTKRDIKPEEIKDFDFAALGSTAGNFITVRNIEDKTFTNNDIFDKLQTAMDIKLNDNTWTTTY